MDEHKIKGTDEVWGDSFRILIHADVTEENAGQMLKGTLLEFYRSLAHEQLLTFDEVVQIAKDNGFTEGTFELIAETPLEGTIYQYANCYDGEPFWSEYGKTRGYA